MSRPATAAVRLLSGEREPVRVATTVNIDLYGLETIDGVALAVADRVLVKNQTDGRENGIYTVSTGRWYRASDANHPRAITEGVTVQVQEGEANGGKVFRFNTLSPTIGTDDIEIDFYLSANLTAEAEAIIEAGKGELDEYTGELQATVLAAVNEAIEFAAEGGFLGTFLQAGDGAMPRPYLTKNRDWIHIGDFAVGGVGGDDAFGIQKAFERSALTGKRIVAPALADGNTYRTTEPIVMSRPFRIEGDGTTPLLQRNFGFGINTRGPGSWFHADHDGHALELVSAGSEETTGAYLKGIGIIRNQPTPIDGPFTPADNDFDIYARKCELLLEDVTLLNATRGIDYEGERMEIKGLRGQPLLEGIRMDKCYDVVRIYDVQFWTYWSSSVEVAQYLINNATAIRSGRNDHPFMKAIFTIFYQYGMELFLGTDGATNLLRAYGVSFDRGQTGLYVTANGAEAEFFGIASQAEVDPPIVPDVSATFGANMTVLGNGNYIKCYSPDLRFARNNSVYVGGTGNNLIMENPRHNSWGQANPLGGFGCYNIESGNSVDIMGKVTNFTPSQLFRSGAGALNRVIKRAFVSGTTDGIGDLLITHPIAEAATYVETIVQGGVGRSYAYNLTGTSFKIRVMDAAGTPLASTAVTVSYTALSA